MADLFSYEWMNQFKDEWNNEPELAEALKSIDFDSVIGYGIDGEDHPRGVIVVEKGQVTDAHTYSGEELNWDIRASSKDWGAWAKKPPGMVGLGMAYSTRKLKFITGDYAAMIKDPRMASPFIKSFSVMGRVK